MITRSDILFGLGKGGSSSYLSGTLFFKCISDNVNISNTPCLVDKNAWENEAKGEVTVQFPFPRHRGFPPNDTTAYVKENILVNNKPIFVKKNRIKIIEKFDFDKVVDLQNYINANEIITFQMWNLPICAKGFNALKVARATAESMLEFLYRINTELLSKYKYASAEFCKFNDDYRAKNPANLLYYLTFISLPNCIPIFNPKKVEGMALIIRVVKEEETRRNGALRCASEIAVLLTNHLDNKFVVDGISLSGIDPLQEGTLKRMSKIVEANSGIINEEKKKKEGGITFAEEKLAEPIRCYYSSTTSSTATYS